MIISGSADAAVQENANHPAVDVQRNGSPYFTGQTVCASCHAGETQAWLRSDHARSMLPVNNDSVLGDFDNVTFSSGQRSTRFFIENDRYFIETPGRDGKTAKFEVKYTFGFEPLQQYLVETDKGRLQAFDIAWDSRKKEKGGQRWYQLQDDFVTDPEHPFFWTGYYQNWNSRCASCHSTNLEKNFEPATQTFNTTWTDINVSCESCHGPGSEHVRLAESHKLIENGTAKQNGLKMLGQQIAFHFAEGDAIAQPVTPDISSQNNLALETCGGCHSRRAELAEPDVTKPYHQQYQLDPVNSPLYFNDGQIQDEVFVLGSFLQSKMAQAGVTCTNCHDPHSGETILPGAQVCSTCHRADVFATPLHTNNHMPESGASDADCLDCHMPARIYMGADDRRDHRFHRSGTQHPNSASACVSCHADKSEAWIQDSLTSWPKRAGAAADTLGNWAALNQALADMDASAVAEANALILSDSLPALLDVALAEKAAILSPQSMVKSVTSLADSDDAIARRGAARSAMSLAPEQRDEILLSLASDSALSVRAEVASAVLSLPADWQAGNPEIIRLLKEYSKVLSTGQDHPGPNIGLAQLALRDGDIIGAKTAYDLAIAVDASSLPARLGYAEFLRSMGNESGAEKQLQAALEYGEDVAAVQFAWALHQIRQRAYSNALPHLKLAAEADDAMPRYGFVYGVALWQTDNQPDALTELQKAAQRWPMDYDILVTLAKYAVQSGEKDIFSQSMAELRKYFPTDSTVQQLERVRL